MALPIPITTTTLVQDQAKAANQGRAGYDVLGNPVAAASSATPAPSPTIASLYGSVPASDQGLDTSVGIYKDIANTPVDEQGIRDATTKRLQAEIDATNSVYAEKLRQAQIAGEGRLGQN